MRSLLFTMMALPVLVHAAHPVRSPASASWLAGCWALRDGSKVVEESWTTESGGTMLGTSRTIVGGRMTEYEFVVLRAIGDRLEYAVRRGTRSEVVFTSTTASARQVIFENTAHPFPKRIGYTRVTADSLDAWIDGGAGSEERVSYSYHRAACGAP